MNLSFSRSPVRGIFYRLFLYNRIGLIFAVAALAILAGLSNTLLSGSLSIAAAHKGPDPLGRNFFVMICLFFIGIFGSSLTLAFSNIKTSEPFLKEVYVLPIRSRDLTYAALAFQFVYVVFFWSFLSFFCLYPIGFNYDFFATLLLCAAQSFAMYSLTIAVRYFVSVPAARYVNTVFYLLCLFYYGKLLEISAIGVGIASIIAIGLSFWLAQKTVAMSRIDDRMFLDSFVEWRNNLFVKKTDSGARDIPRRDFASPFAAQLFFECKDSLRIFVSAFAGVMAYICFLYCFIPGFRDRSMLGIFIQCAVIILLTSGVSRFIGKDGRVLSFCLTRPVRSGYLAAVFETAAVLKPLIVCAFLSCVALGIEARYFQLSTPAQWIRAIEYTAAIGFSAWLLTSQLMLLWIWGALTGQGRAILLLGVFLFTFAAGTLPLAASFITDLFKQISIGEILMALKLVVFLPLLYWTVFRQCSISSATGVILLAVCTLIFLSAYALTSLIPFSGLSSLGLVLASILTPASSLLLPVATLHARRSR